MGDSSNFQDLFRAARAARPPKRGTKVAPAPANPALRPITSSTSLSPSTVSARPSPPDATHPVPSPPASAASLPPDSQQTYLHGPGVAVPAHPEPSVNQGPSARSHFAGTSPPAQRASSVTSRAAPRAAASAESAAGWGGEQGSSGPTPSPPRGRPLGLRGRGGGEGSLEGSTADLGDGYDAHKRAETNADAAMQAPRAVGAKAALPKDFFADGRSKESAKKPKTEREMAEEYGAFMTEVESDAAQVAQEEAEATAHAVEDVEDREAFVQVVHQSRVERLKEAWASKQRHIEEDANLVSATLSVLEPEAARPDIRLPPTQSAAQAMTQFQDAADGAPEAHEDESEAEDDPAVDWRARGILSSKMH